MSFAAPGVAAAFAAAGARMLLVFGVVFYGADWLAGRHAWRVPLHMAWELSMPYWPAAYPVYFSVFALPFVLLRTARSAATIRRWERAMVVAIVVAGVFFVALPAQPAYAPADAAGWRGWALLAQLVTGRHNLLPSLHVALAGLTVCTASRGLGRAARWLLWAWYAMLVASVLVTHQHHVADVIAGLVLAAVVQRTVGSGRRDGEPAQREARDPR